MNFLKHVMQQLDDDSLGLLGAVLGENESKVRDGVRSAVPKILDSMVSVTNTEQGRNMLWRELRDTDASVASSFSKQMYYKDSQALVANGHDQLEGLIGSEAKNLIQSVSRESDIGSTSAKRLVGAVTPLVFASVANHQQSKQLNQNELGAVIAQQKSHLSAWQRDSDQYFASAANDDDRNEPLFSAQSPRSGSAKAPVVATAVGSAALGMHHFGNRDKDKDGQEDSGLTVGATSLSSSKEKNPSDAPGGVDVNESARKYDKRSYDRRQRDAIAAHPANSGFAANTHQDSDQPSKSVVAGSIAATGAGVAAVVATAISPAAKAKAEAAADAKNRIAGQTDYKSEFSTATTGAANTTSRAHSEATNTYDSKNPVSGFAAADPAKSVATNQVETNGGNAESDANSKLWTPDTAQQRGADGTLQYPDRDVTARTPDHAGAASEPSGGWFHWLWWPVLILGSLLGLCLMFLNTNGDNPQPTNQDQIPSVVATSDGESAEGQSAEGESASNDAANANTTTVTADPPTVTADAPTVTADATELTAGDENPKGSEGTSKESDSSILSSSIQIAPPESDAATKTADPFNELSPGLESADPSNEGNNDLAAKTQDAVSTMPKATEDTTAGSKTTNQDVMPSLEGSIEADEAKTGTDSDGGNDNPGEEGNNNLELNTTDLELDADEQVEELLTAIETELEQVNDEAQAKVVEKSLSQHISGLEKVLAQRAQWKDEIGILVDFQLEEGQKMLAQAKKNAFQSEAVKKTLKGKFKQLNKLMKTTNDSP